VSTERTVKQLSESSNAAPGGDIKPENMFESSSGNSVAFDAIVLAAFVFLVGLLAIKFDILEALVEWSSAHEEYEVDEIITVLMVSSIGLLLFTFRRLLELRDEVKRRRFAEDSVNHIAMYDRLTGLPNRIMAKQQLARELARASRDGSDVAVLVIDLDRFKPVNDVFGLETGDELLRVFAERMSSKIRDMDTLARFGADEFIVIQPGVVDSDSALKLAARLVEAMSLPLKVNAHVIDSSISVGVAISSDCQYDSAEMLRSADIAVHRAKSEGGAAYRFFETDMHVKLQDRQSMEQDLRRAIESDALTLHYQPLFNVNTKELLGFEALLRWHDPVRGNVSPVDFIPIAEETGLIVGLGNWVLETACRDALQWPGERKIAVNLSPVQFRDPELPRKVSAILDRTGLPPERLELEITEGVLIEDAEAALKLLMELKGLGVRISMDDFGTGYSSLSYLKLFPFDKIKIDRSFVSHLESGSEDAVIVKAILAMGHSLGMIATAEGVESDEQLTYLHDEGCDEAQGFLLGRPMPFDQAHDLSQASASLNDALSSIAANDFQHMKKASGG